MAFPFGAAFAAFMAASGGPAPSALPPQPAVQQVVPLIEPAVLKQMLQAPAPFVLVDVRRPDEFAAGHIEGAKLIPLDTLPAVYAQLPRDVQLVIYCRAGHRSAKAVSFLQSQGYTRAVSLNGGYLAFSALP